ncbi:amidohydrolase family protein [Xylophilus sp. GOD-11R]|uniref:metal-dependent hydrolase family protein n=1 Tax=Xylophilus sp. GOD-11R TaxID=3089814 RepID=UPI00298BF807|nr:amidohydrolase family protein [Xylophilus sp. GOD-11R]WPB57626.1 amidohydrolase family protein [Xylophilus sp. GOD-11R]
MTSRTFIRCGRLFDGLSGLAETDRTLVLYGDTIDWAGPTAQAPAPQPGDRELDYSAHFVMPGMVDCHAHISYGNALAQEDIDLYATMEFRTLRSMVAAQAILKSGFTSIMDPACSGLIAPAVRDAVNVGLVQGPRITASGRALTTQQGLYDWYPSWVGVPEPSTGIMTGSMEEAIRIIRQQARDGVDAIKLTMDGIHARRNGGGLIAAYTQAETHTMVDEIHRLGKLAVVHARGKEGALYAARAGVDIVFHASNICDDGIQAALDNSTWLCPSLALLVNNIEFHEPTDASAPWWPDIQRRELVAASQNLRRARAAGVRFMSGSEAGFAVTPYGEWGAKELEAHVRYLGFTPAEAIRCATVDSTRLLRERDKLGGLVIGKLADIVVVDGDPLADITVLQRREAIHAVLLGGQPVDLTPAPTHARHFSEFSQGMWSKVYDRAYVNAHLQPAAALAPQTVA